MCTLYYPPTSPFWKYKAMHVKGLVNDFYSTADCIRISEVSRQTKYSDDKFLCMVVVVLSFQSV